LTPRRFTCHFPHLVDTGRDVTMYESDEIVDYPEQHYEYHAGC